MTVDLQQMEKIMARPLRLAAAGELRREENVFFLGAALPVHQVLETIFDSDTQSPVELFIFSFAVPEDFLRAEELVRAVKKNFKGYLLGKFDGAPSTPILDLAYAAGIDLIDLPLPPADLHADRKGRLNLLAHAQSIFPRWSVLSSLSVGAEPLAATVEKIEALLTLGVVPIVTASEQTSRLPAPDLLRLFSHLERSWSRARVALRPLRPLLQLATPLTAPPKKGLGGLLERLDDARLRTASDLRRLLRVREVEQSFESAGL